MLDMSPASIERYKSELIKYNRMRKPIVSANSNQPNISTSPAAKDSYETFLSANPGRGTLKVMITAGQQTLPIKGAEVTVSRKFDGQPYVFYQLTTDADGIADNMLLPAPPRVLSEAPESALLGKAEYIVEITYPELNKHRSYQAQIYDGIESILPVDFDLSEMYGNM